MLKLSGLSPQTSIFGTVLGSTLVLIALGAGARRGVAQPAANSQADPAPINLQTGQLVNREIAAGEKHAYLIALAEKQYFRVQIKQTGSAVSVWLQQPDGSTISIIDLPTRKPEITFERAVDAGGTYRLELRAGAKSPAGHYEIQLADVHESNQRERDLQKAQVLFEKFLSLQREGRDLEARSPLLGSLEIREQVLGPDDLIVADMVAYLANNFMNTDDYASAEPLLERSLHIRETKFGPDSPEAAGALRELALFHFERGDLVKAEELLQKVLAVFEKSGLKDGITSASVFDSLGDIHYSWNNYEKASTYYLRANAILEKDLGSANFHLAPSLTRIGRSAYDAGDYAPAETAFQRALALGEKGLGPDSLRLVSYINDLAMLYATMGKRAEAEALYQRVLAIEKKIGQHNPDLRTLFGMARLQAAAGNSAAALKLQSEASEIEERYIALNLAVGSERERIAFLNQLSLLSSQNISLHIRLAPDDQDARVLALTTILRRKGRVQDAMSNSLAALHQRSNQEDQKVLGQLKVVTSSLAHLVLGGPQGNSPLEYQAQVRKLEDERELLEDEINRRSAGFYERGKPVRVTDVQSAVPADAALIEFAVYRPFDPAKPANEKSYAAPRYVAYVIRNRGAVEWKDLGAKQEIDNTVRAWREALRDPARRDTPKLARAVDQKIMQPVRGLAGDAKQLLLSPDGELNVIPFAALIDERGQYLVERYALTYLTSGRDLLRLQVKRESRSDPVVLADPAFGQPAIISASAGANGSASRARFDYSKPFFGPLPGAGDEVRSLKSILPRATFLTGTQATKSALKQIQAPGILHLATHGFFLDKPRVQTGAADNPLLRSGLALAGANSGLGSETGILTALEAAGLDLWGTKLVVLSACDTGIGEIRSDEGVYGLRRALVLAGAETQLMSLWPVSDRSTRDLMIGYYRRLMQGQGRGEALRQVQLEMLRDKTHSHPFYWAGFIQSGEWANLQEKR